MKRNTQEGNECPECSAGKMIYTRKESCSCHIHPPCSACVDAPLVCDVCDYEEEKEDVEFVPIAPGLHISVNPYRELDSSKIDFHSRGHTAATMIKTGVYPEGTTIEDVRRRVNGTFGGRFEQFGNGTFRFIAYTD